MTTEDQERLDRIEAKLDKVLAFQATVEGLMAKFLPLLVRKAAKIK